MIRLLFLVHRYLGIAVGFVLLLWCLSGFVMMYMQFPELEGNARYAVAPELELTQCCQFPNNPGLAAVPFTQATLAMLNAQTPVLRAGLPQAAALNIELSGGREFSNTNDLDELKQIASDFSQRQLGGATYSGPLELSSDQWTITEEYNPHRPLLKFSANDALGTQWYISGRTGEVVLITTAKQRGWNYVGAIVHWLYPSLLRRNMQVWSQTVIWLSLLGGFLTITGLYIGIRQFGRRRSGKFSPYSGLAMWHHYTGMVFGVITLIWVASGTLSMNPLGLLLEESYAQASEALRDGHLNWSEIRNVMTRAAQVNWPADTVQLDLVKLAGTSFLVTTARDGSKARYFPDSFIEAPLDLQELERLEQSLLGQAISLESTLLVEEDSYYYDQHEDLEFPVYRIRSGDEQSRIYYLSGTSGELLKKVDSGSRWYRWLFTGLHSADFAAPLRARPFWDIVMWLFLLGTTAVCGTGTWMAIRRLSRP